MRFQVLATVLGLALAAPAFSDATYTLPDDPDESEFIQNEVIATFYHELGHALIDNLGLPVLGKEEDAADNLSVILMNDIWDEESAAAILSSDALSYALMADTEEQGGQEPPYWDVHSLNLQRYYSVVCLFYGANPDDRAQLAKDLELPEERADGCPAEFEQAAGGWDQVLEQNAPGDDSAGLVMEPGQSGDLVDLLADEIGSINERFGLPNEVVVRVADCGEANAYYNPEDRSITMCNEYAQNLQDMWEAQ